MPKFRMGLHDGKKRFYSVFAGKIVFPKGLSSLLIATAPANISIDYTPIKYDDSFTKEEFIAFIKSLNLPFKPRDYQLKSSYDSLVRHRQINLMATNAGKSLTQYIITRFLISKGNKVVIIVPRTLLVEQMYSDFVEYGWNDIEE
jgi:superfamily II DNA or RNA helicase